MRPLSSILVAWCCCTLVLLLVFVNGLEFDKRVVKQQTPRSVTSFALMASMQKVNPPFASRALEQDPDYLQLSTVDRAFSRVLLMTAERRAGQIDKVIQGLLSPRTTTKVVKRSAADDLCQAALKIGVAQLMFLGVPPYAAVSETVEVLRMHPRVKVPEGKIRFVNAILRSVDRLGKDAALAQTSILDNVDPWLLDEWINAYGPDRTKMIVEAAMSESPTFLTVNQMSVPSNDIDDDDEAQQRRLETVRNSFATAPAAPRDGDVVDTVTTSPLPELLPTGSIRIDRWSGPVSKWPLYDSGSWWVQNPSATLPAIALWKSLRSTRCTENSNQSLKDLHVVELCSAPGGKTAQLCSYGFGRVDAIEIDVRRSKILRQNLKRLGMLDSCNVAIANATEWKPSPNKNVDNASVTGPILVDGIIVDAPCSATGTVSRRPEVLRKTVNLGELQTTQMGILAHAADALLKPGGILVYATCSLLKQEGEDQVNWLLSAKRRMESANPETVVATMQTVPFLPGEIPGFDDAIDENGWLRILPGTLPGSLRYCDGFFVARLQKVLDVSTDSR